MGSTEIRKAHPRFPFTPPPLPLFLAGLLLLASSASGSSKLHINPARTSTSPSTTASTTTTTASTRPPTTSNNITTIISWSSQPVRPGQAILLQGWPFSNASAIEMAQPQGAGGPAWRQVQALGATEFGITAIVPANFSYDEFLVRADGGPTHYANRINPWYVFGNLGEAATPGGWFRVLGESLTLTEPLRSVAFLTDLDTGSNWTLAAQQGPTLPATTPFHLYFQLPAAIPPGRYAVNVARSYAATQSPLCTFINTTLPCLSWLNVVAKPDFQQSWAARTNVITVNASRPLFGFYAQDAVDAAFAQASYGSVVFFPRGQYFLTKNIVVPDGVMVLGEGTRLVSIYFHEDNTTTAPDAYITCSGASWALENVTMYVTSYFNNIVRTSSNTTFFSMQGVRIRATDLFCQDPVIPSGRRGRSVYWPIGLGTAVMLAGRNIFIYNNDIYSSADVISTFKNGAPGASYMHIANNLLYNGQTAHWGVSWKQCIFENNVMQGVAPYADGSNYPQYEHDNGDPHVQHIYHNNNSYSLVWGGDREMMTFDGGGGVFFGPVVSAVGQNLTLSQRAADSQPGGALCVLSGPGTGQCRRVLSAGLPDGPAPRNFDSVVLMNCSTSISQTQWTFVPDPSSPGEYKIASSAAANLYLAADCASSGNENTNATNCGTNSEGILLQAETKFIRAARTNQFLLPDAFYGGKLLLGKSDLCVGVSLPAGPSSTLELSDCDSKSMGLLWKIQDSQLVEQSSGLCVGVTSVTNYVYWQVDRPFSPGLTTESNVTIMPYVGKFLFNANHYFDGGAVQLFTQAIEVIAAYNLFERMGGLVAWARQEETNIAWNANLMVQFLNNTFKEGNHVYNYNVLPPESDPVGRLYFPGGSKCIEPWTLGSLSNDQGYPIDPYPPLDFVGAFNRYIVMRDNVIENNGGIIVAGTTANCLVQSNIIMNSDVGIHVNYTTTQGGIVLLDNQEPPWVPPNYNPYL